MKVISPTRAGIKIILPVLYIGLAGVTLFYYLDWQSANFITGLVACYFCLRDKHPSEGLLRYGYASAIFFILFLLLPVKTILYLTLVFALLFFRESFYGRLSPAVLIVFLLLSPLADYAANLAGFPVRLQLTDWAGQLIGLTGTVVRVQGNVIACGGNEFSVDPACMGLHMLLSSLLTGLALTGFYQGRYRLLLRMGPVLLLLVAVLGLNILANLFRIILLVHFSILPENPMHGLTGMLCLAVYVLIPLIPASRRLVLRCGRPVTHKHTPVTPNRSRILLSANLLVAGCTLAAALISVLREKNITNTGKNIPAIPGYVVQRTSGNVLKLSKKGSLVYLKPIPAFYYTDHSPMICWVGSGYTFHEIREESLYDHQLYTGVLQNGRETLYTAWWFDNGTKQTPDQLDWRWDALRGGGNYSIVNITTSGRKELEDEIRQVLRTNPFREALLQNP
jgi:exosortase N